MTVDDFLDAIEDKMPLENDTGVSAFEDVIGARLPSDYRGFLIRCNGGYVGGEIGFHDSNDGSEGPDVNHIGGFRYESYFSLEWSRDCYQQPPGIRIPTALIWIMDDSFGNAICLGIKGAHVGKVYFWDHEEEPDQEEWDYQVVTASNLSIVAQSFTAFIEGLEALED